MDMDPLLYSVKEEYPGSNFAPQPMEGLHDNGPPPFLTKTYDMVDDQSTSQIVSWSRGGKSFVVWDPNAFSTNLLPRYFKHNNFSSFVRQLNTYGFRKINPDGWEFATEGFIRGQKQLLKNIKKRKNPTLPNSSQESFSPFTEAGLLGLDGEVNKLRRDKQALVMELVKLKQQQQHTRVYLRKMEQRLEGTEQKQQQMMTFLAKAVQNPSFIQKLVQRKERLKEVGDAVSKKRGRSIDRRSNGESSRNGERYSNPIKIEDHEFGGCGYEVSELEALAMEMQGFGRATKGQEEEMEQTRSLDKEFDEGFWEELLNESFKGNLELEISGSEVAEDEDVGVLADQLGYLRSNSI